jgi:UDP-N-acetylmuramate--alanine ligase
MCERNFYNFNVRKKVGDGTLQPLKAGMNIHFIGIGGYGMSALAKVMLEKGLRVSGSDLASGTFIEKLQASGANIHIGHDAQWVADADLVVYSTACAPDNVEIVAARAQGIEVIHRADLLALLLNGQKGIAVAGAHGKTTTSSMIAVVMELCGTQPTYVIGGEVVNFGNNAQAGAGPYVVAEADESDRSFLKYEPQVAVVTNIEADHLENYGGDFNVLLTSYQQFLRQIKPGGSAVICLDDPYLRAMLPELNQVNGLNVRTYALSDEAAEYRAVEIVEGDRRISFTVERNGARLGEVELFVPGRHNVANALATLLTAEAAAVPFAEAARALRDFRGAKRRFQVIGEHKDVLVVDDYAHHPTEIVATLKAARATGRRVWAVFQPQRYTRTYFLFDEFSKAFAEADEVIITDIYSPAGEQPIEGITAQALVERVRHNSHAGAQHIATKEQALDYLMEHIRAGDLLLTMGAGDIWRLAVGVADRLK